MAVHELSIIFMHTYAIFLACLLGGALYGQYSGQVIACDDTGLDLLCPACLLMYEISKGDDNVMMPDGNPFCQLVEPNL